MQALRYWGGALGFGVLGALWPGIAEMELARAFSPEPGTREVERCRILG